MGHPSLLGVNQTVKDHRRLVFFLFDGDSPFSLKPIEERYVWRNESAAWPVANPVVTCTSVSNSGFLSKFVVDPFLYVQKLFDPGQVLYYALNFSNQVDQYLAACFFDLLLKQCGAMGMQPEEVLDPIAAANQNELNLIPIPQQQLPKEIVEPMVSRVENPPRRFTGLWRAACLMKMSAFRLRSASAPLMVIMPHQEGASRIALK